MTADIRYRPLRTRDRLAGWPEATALCVETRRTVDYQVRGRDRAHETFSLFTWTLSGRGVFARGRDVRAVGPGEGFLIRVADPEVRYGFPSDAREPWSFAYLTFDGPGIAALVDGLVAARGSILRIAPRHGVFARIRALALAGAGPLDSTAADSAGLAWDLLAALGSGSASESADGSEALALVERARAALAALPPAEWSVARLASALRCSRSHLNDGFLAAIRVAPGRYLTRRRLVLAGTRLQSSSDDLAAIAAAVGYRDGGTLGRAFTRNLGMSPSVFRRRGVLPTAWGAWPY